VVHAFKTPLQEPGWAIAWILLVLCLAGLMTSTIRFYSFKDIPWTRKQPSVAIVALAVLGAAIWRWSEVVLLFLATTYAVTGVTLHVVRYVRRRTATRSA
jgi:phosphatidylserine synthase